MGPLRKWWTSLLRTAPGAPALEPSPEPPPSPTALETFLCNVCGTTVPTENVVFERETPSCFACASTVRMRALVHVLSMELFGESLPLQEFPTRKEIRGLGMSDWSGYSKTLEEKFAYHNSFLDREPLLDICDPPAHLLGSLDFIVSSDVFEHVAPPVEVAFTNARKLLAPGGVLIFSVPYMSAGTNIEHFPELFDHSLVASDGKPVLINITRTGERQVFENLVFHGGEGSTLEMRVFSEPTLLAQLEAAGFASPRIYGSSVGRYGIHWRDPLSLPMALRSREPSGA